MTYYSSYYVLSPYDLEHHGILGMKWGVRRYQNKDGTLTPEGKRRYGSVENFNAERSVRRERVIKTAAAGAVALGAAAAGGAGYLINKYAGAQVASLAGPAIQAGRKVVGDLGSKLSNTTMKVLNPPELDPGRKFYRQERLKQWADYAKSYGFDPKKGYWTSRGAWPEIKYENESGGTLTIPDVIERKLYEEARDRRLANRNK